VGKDPICSRNAHVQILLNIVSTWVWAYRRLYFPRNACSRWNALRIRCMAYSIWHVSKTITWICLLGFVTQWKKTLENKLFKIDLFKNVLIKHNKNLCWWMKILHKIISINSVKPVKPMLIQYEASYHFLFWVFEKNSIRQYPDN